MRLFASIGALVLLGMASPCFTGEASVAPAQAAAQKWLALIDSADYAGSWSTAARHFRDSIPQSRWQAMVASVRDPLGAVQSRQLTSASLVHSLPGAPDGDYVVIQFSTRFEHKAAATETVTPMREPDGQWRVSGYYVR